MRRRHWSRAIHGSIFCRVMALLCIATTALFAQPMIQALPSARDPSDVILWQCLCLSRYIVDSFSPHSTCLRTPISNLRWRSPQVSFIAQPNALLATQTGVLHAEKATSVHSGMCVFLSMYSRRAIVSVSLRVRRCKLFGVF